MPKSKLVAGQCLIVIGTEGNSAQAGQHSATMHYLKAVAAMGLNKAKASGRATIAQMKAIPIQDAIYGTSVIS